MALVTSACAPLPRHLCEVVVCTRGEFAARSALLCALAVSALLSTTAGVSVFGVVMPAWCVMVRCGILTYFMLCVCGKGVYCVHVGAKGVT